MYLRRLVGRHVCMCVSFYVCMHACMHAWMYVCMYAWMYVCMYGDGSWGGYHWGGCRPPAGTIYI